MFYSLIVQKGKDSILTSNSLGGSIYLLFIYYLLAWNVNNFNFNKKIKIKCTNKQNRTVYKIKQTNKQTGKLRKKKESENHHQTNK